MQWSAEPGLGFSDGTAWLISPKPDVAINVEDQEKDPNSNLELLPSADSLVSPLPFIGNTIRLEI